MKRKKTRLLTVALGTAIVLAGCLSPNVPKEAYVKGMTKLEEVSSYEKTSTVKVDVETNGEWATHQSVFWQLLNHSTIEAVSLVDEIKQQSETTVHLTGGTAYAPLNANLHILFDEANEQTYIEGKGVVDALSPYVTLPSVADNTWIEIGKQAGTSKNTGILAFLLHLDFQTVWNTISEAKFERITVSESDKKAGIRDRVTLSLTHTELQQIFPQLVSFSKDVTIERVTFTADLNWRGRVVQENIESKLIVQQDKHSVTLHTVMQSRYEKRNKSVELTPLPTKTAVMPLSSLLPSDTKTEKAAKPK